MISPTGIAGGGADCGDFGAVTLLGADEGDDEIAAVELAAEGEGRTIVLAGISRARIYSGTMSQSA